MDATGKERRQVNKYRGLGREGCALLDGLADVNLEARGLMRLTVFSTVLTN